MRVGTTKEWSFVSAQTDVALVTAGASEMLVVTYVQATCANSNTGDVSCRLGFAVATLPTLSDDSATGATGVFFSHGAIAKGGGAIAANGGEVIANGTAGQDLRITCGPATGGSLRLVVTYQLITIDPGA